MEYIKNIKKYLKKKLKTKKIFKTKEELKRFDRQQNTKRKNTFNGTTFLDSKKRQKVIDDAENNRKLGEF